MKLVYKDMDGILVDWIAGVARLFGFSDDSVHELRKADERRDIAGFLGVSNNVLWKRIEAAGSSFWAELPELEDGMALYRALYALPNIRVLLLSSPTWAPGSYAGKAQWAQDRFGLRFSGLHLAREKWHHAGPGRLLVDDSPVHCDEWSTHPRAIPGGEAILVPRLGSPGRAQQLEKVLQWAES